MPKAIKGDYNISNDLRTLNKEEMINYEFIDCIGKYNLYRRINIHVNLINNYDYILGYMTSKGFEKVAKIYFNKIENYYEVDTIYVSKNMRGNNIATKLYTYFIQKYDYIILSSNMQRFGARKLWSKLSRKTDLIVDIIDFENNQIIEENVKVYHGDLDEEFDKRVWSYDNDKKHIRLILKDIK